MVYFIFVSNGGASERRGVSEKLPPSLPSRWACLWVGMNQIK